MIERGIEPFFEPRFLFSFEQFFSNIHISLFDGTKLSPPKTVAIDVDQDRKTVLFSFGLQFADPAECFRSDSEKGGEHVLWHALHNGRICFNEIEVALLCRCGEGLYYALILGGA